MAKNAWDGTEYEQFGEAVEAAIVLSVIGEGLPHLQRTGSREQPQARLLRKGPIDWQPHPWASSTKLFAIKKENRALWNGA